MKQNNVLYGAYVPTSHDAELMTDNSDGSSPDLPIQMYDDDTEAMTVPLIAYAGAAIVLILWCLLVAIYITGF